MNLNTIAKREDGHIATRERVEKKKAYIHNVKVIKKKAAYLSLLPAVRREKKRNLQYKQNIEI
jgi:hypothetical protein